MAKRNDNTNSKNKKDNFHAGHRARMKQRYLEQGIESMEDHEVLEMLLYYALPYRDTNGLAHLLMNEFGSLANVLEADSYALQKVKGIGANASLLLNFIPKLAGRYYQDRWSKLPILDDAGAINEYIKALFVGLTKETLFMICMNAKGEVKNSVKLSEGTVGEIFVYIPTLLETALQQKCRFVILAHNHPGGVSKVSRDDIDMTRSCKKALDIIGVKLLDHVIVCGNQTVSMKENNLFRQD